jgi:hypothetical protein
MQWPELYRSEVENPSFNGYPATPELREMRKLMKRQNSRPVDRGVIQK